MLLRIAYRRVWQIIHVRGSMARVNNRTARWFTVRGQSPTPQPPRVALPDGQRFTIHGQHTKPVMAKTPSPTPLAQALADLGSWLYPSGKLEGGFLRPLMHEDDAAAFQVLPLGRIARGHPTWNRHASQGRGLSHFSGKSREQL